jgi:hypothetical protein
MADVEFMSLNAELYRHPGERAARARLEKIPGFKKAVDALFGYAGNEAERQVEAASMVRVGPGVYPVLGEMWKDIRRQFGLGDVPLSIGWNMPSPCALRGGDDRPGIVLDSRMLDDLPEREMFALLAMQAGSLRLGNAALIAACDFSRWFLDFYGIAGAPAALPAWGLENWRRYALFSADRAAALVNGDPEAVVALLDRFAGAGEKRWGGIVKPDDLRIQGIEAMSMQGDWSNSRLRRFVLAMNRQNSVALIRRADILDWFASGTPARILSGEATGPEGAKIDPAAVGQEADKDPSVAYWGEFAGTGGGEERDAGAASAASSAASAALGDLRDMAEKGVSSFFKAGEAFWNVLTEETRKK